MILIICGEPGQSSIWPVVEELRRRHLPYEILNQESLPDVARISHEIGNGGGSESIVRSSERVIPLGSVSAAWYWHPVRPQVHEANIGQVVKDFCDDEWYWFTYGLWNILPCYWLNHPHWIRQAESKILQLTVARSLGFRLPDTLISNDPAEIAHFFNKHHELIIHKTLMSPFAKNAHGRTFPLYTEKVSRQYLRNWRGLTSCPVIYQELVEKQYDIRVTVVGQQVFPVEIHSQDSQRSMLDFRHYDIENTPYIVHDMPDQVRTKCLAMSKMLNLDYGAIDLILTREGEYVFLEINPSGQYGWIEYLTKLPITSAICDLLGKHER